MDNVINVSDAMMIAGCFNYKNGDSKYNNIFDLNADGAINMMDIIILAKNFNKVGDQHLFDATPAPTPTPVNDILLSFQINNYKDYVYYSFSRV